MNEKPTRIIAIMLLLVASSVALMTAVSAESMLSETEQTKVPRYSESCAHAHNGYDCKEPSFRTDITDLQKRVSELERRH